MRRSGVPTSTGVAPPEDKECPNEHRTCLSISSSIGSQDASQMSQTCGGPHEVLGAFTFMMVRVFGQGDCFPYISLVLSSTVSLQELRFKHVHNHNPGYPTFPGYDAQLQLGSEGLQGTFGDVGSLVKLSPTTGSFEDLTSVDLSSGPILNPGTYILRWVPQNLAYGSNTGSEFFALAQVEVFVQKETPSVTPTISVTVSDTPSISISQSPSRSPWLDPMVSFDVESAQSSGGVSTVQGQSSDVSIAATLSQTCGGPHEVLGAFTFMMVRVFGQDDCFPYISLVLSSTVSLQELRFKHIHNHNPGYPTFPEYDAQLQLGSEGLQEPFGDVGSLVKLSPTTGSFEDLTSVDLSSGPILNPGTYILRWVPRNLNGGSNTGSEFFALAQVEVFLQIETPSLSPTISITPSVSPTVSVTVSDTPSVSVAVSDTPSISVTATRSFSQSPSRSPWLDPMVTFDVETVQSSGNVSTVQGQSSDVSIAATLSQTCGGPHEVLGAYNFVMVRTFGQGDCFPYISLVLSSTVSLQELRFKHVHNHNPGFPTFPEYDAQLQLGSGGLQGTFVDVGSLVKLSPITSSFEDLSSVDLTSSPITVGAGMYILRWVSRNLSGGRSHTDTDFLALAQVELFLKVHSSAVIIDFREIEIPADPAKIPLPEG
eukprot:g76180.t1